tara:strand:+ start:160 stop:489 length:330 start_codon:yes stop_codon:yes gene_type:complete
LIDSLKNSESFLEIISKGQKFTESGLTFYFLKKNDLNESKFGVSIKKITGNAVYRNKLKRQIKNLIRLNQEKIKSFDIVVINYQKRLKPIEYSELDYIFNKFFNNLSLV